MKGFKDFIKGISKIIFLEINFDEIKNRIHNFETRGIAKANNQSLEELFRERQILYNKYAEITIDCNVLDQEELAAQIAQLV